MKRNRVKLSFFCWYWFRRGAGEYSRVGVGSVFVLVFFCFFFIFFIFVFFCNRKGRADPSASAHGNRWIMKASMNNEFVVLLISFHLCFFFFFVFFSVFDRLDWNARPTPSKESVRSRSLDSINFDWVFFSLRQPAKGHPISGNPRSTDWSHWLMMIESKDPVKPSKTR